MFLVFTLDYRIQLNRVAYTVSIENITFRDDISTVLAASERCQFVSIVLSLSCSPHLSLLQDGGPQNLTLTVIENEDVFYSARVDVGTPAKTFTMLLDTGSSDFWVREEIFSGIVLVLVSCVASS